MQRVKTFLDSPVSAYCAIGACIPLAVIIMWTANKQGWGLAGFVCALFLLIGMCLLWMGTLWTRTQQKTLSQYVEEIRKQK